MVVVKYMCMKWYYIDTLHVFPPGYSGIYQKRTGSHRDGSAIFYLSSRLTLLDWAGVQYQRQTKVLNRDNVGIIGTFATQESNRLDV